MNTFKTIISDFERPLNTSLEDSIHMPQNHNNRPKRKSRRYLEHKHANNAGVVQTTNVLQATGVVPPEQRHVAPTMMGNEDEGRSVTYTYVPGKGYRENRPTATLDARVSGGDEGGMHSKIQNPQHPNVVAGSVHQATFPARMMFGNLPSRPPYKTRTSSGPILDEVLRMRADVRDKIVEDMGNDPKHDAKGKGKEKQDEPRADVVEELPRSETPELIPDMEVSVENWAEPLYELAALERRSGPINALSNAMEELSIYQDIGSPTRGYKVKVMTPPLVNVDLVAESSVEAKKDVVQTEAQAKKVEQALPSVPSKESFRSAEFNSSDDFEKLEKPAAAESEENGGRRKWYKGFRR